MSGFITIERKLWDHPLFKPSEMTEREAWVWMIVQAAWADTRHRVGNELVDVPRGSFMATLREMQSAFMWRTDKRVRTFLKTLEKEGMIGRTVRGAKNAPKTHVTICNYDEYQSGGRTKDAPKTHERTHHGRTTDAVKKQVNKITKEERTSDDVLVTALAEIVGPDISKAFVAHRKELKKPLTVNAINAMAKKLEGHHDPGAVLTDSIANGWQGIFPDKVRNTTNQLKAINGGQYDQSSHNSAQRSDPALEQIARLAGISTASGNGSV